jgi:hypothetical protein
VEQSSVRRKFTPATKNALAFDVAEPSKSDHFVLSLLIAQPKF